MEFDESPAVRRAEWRRFAVAALMVTTVVVEVVVLAVTGWCPLWLWPPLIAVEGWVLTRLNVAVWRARREATYAWFAEMDRQRAAGH